jgi:alcohol dehydrogenase class IV
MSGLDYSPLAHAIFGHKVANSQSPFEVSRANAQFIQSLQELIADLQLPTKLRDVGIQSFDVEALAIDAMKQTRLLPNNPREVTLHDAVELYSQAL